MKTYRSRSQWDPRYDRVEHVAGDGIVDFVSYELLPGATLAPHSQTTKRSMWIWFTVAVEVVHEIVVDQVSAWLQSL